MKAWMIFTTLAILLVWLFARRQDDGPPPPPPSKPQNVAAAPDPANEKSYPESEQLSLLELLEKPRAELAELAIEKEQQIVAQDKARNDQVLVFTFMPSARFPTCVPIWQKARYSAKRDMVLPPYLDEAAFDATLALHLARFGDAEAARKLVPPDDKATLAEVNKLALSRNFPAEWTRLVALIMHRSHYSLAEGNNDGARRVVSLHQQLNALLDDDARNSALGAALLPRGRMLLHQAVLAWSQGEGQDELVEMASRSLAEWGEQAPSLPSIHSADELARWLGGESRGLLVSGGNPQRALDIMGVPLPVQALRNVVGLFDRTGKLQEYLFIYGPEWVEMHEKRSFVMNANVALDVANHPHLSYWLEEQLAWQPAAQFSADVHRTSRNAYVGSLARIIPRLGNGQGFAPARTPILPGKTLPRDFGLVDLDRTFETNRRFFSWHQSGSKISVSDPKVLANLKLPFPGQKISQAILQRDGKLNLVADFQLVLATDTKAIPNLIDVARPFWEAAGASQIKVTGEMAANSIDFFWNDATTKLCLRLPNQQGDPIVLEASDGDGKDGAERLKQAQQRDDDERNQRWTERKPATRLSRGLEEFDLGMTRAELNKKIGRTKVLRNSMQNGKLISESLTFPLTAEDESEWILRQGVVRFDENGRLTEAKLRFVDGFGKKPGRAQLVLKSIRDRAGAPEVSQDAPSADVKNPPKLFRWQDDATLVLARVDEHGVEVTLRDCPEQYPNGRPLPPLTWLPRGPSSQCAIGMSKALLFKNWQIKTPVIRDDAILLWPAEKSPYDVLLVWLDNDQNVQRVVARHRPTGEVHSSPLTAGKAVAQAWGQQADVLGWPWVQLTSRQGNVLAWSNSDNATQVRIFWQESEGGLRIFTEWK